MINLLLTANLVLSSVATSVATPRGTSVPVEKKEELSNQTLEQYNQDADSMFSNDIKLSNATAKYNCHSYAWYSQNVRTNQYWMNYPDSYYEDGSYVEIQPSQVQIRDRIIYLDSNGNNLHSGIVRRISGQSSNGICGYANTVWVQSKWGYAGLYEHRGDQCPYTYLMGGTAVSVKFYRYNISHTHSYTFTSFDSLYHYAACQCGSVLMEHNFEEQQIFPLGDNEYSPNYIPRYVCADCGYVSNTGGL